MISVIVPIYNVEKYLRECVDSILSQTFTDIEVILVDDGSTDGSGIICDEYGHKDVRVRVFHKPNGGLSSARNFGIDHARGEWFIFIDSDDLWSSKDCLRKLYDYAIEYKLDILRFEYEAVDENLNTLNLIRPDKAQISFRVLSNYEMVRYAVSGEWFAWLYLIKKEVLLDIRFNESVKFQEDIDFYCRLFAMKELRCGYVAETFYLYRKRESSITTTPKIENLIGSFNLCDLFCQQSETTGIEGIKSLYLYYSVMMYYWTLGTLAEYPYFSFRKMIIRQLNLQELHSRTICRLKAVTVDSRHKVFIMPNPAVGVKMFHFKNTLVNFLKR